MENKINQVLDELKTLLDGEYILDATLTKWLQDKGMTDEEINYVKGQMLGQFFSSVGGKWTYRGPNYIAPLPPNVPH